MTSVLSYQYHQYYLIIYIYNSIVIIPIITFLLQLKLKRKMDPEKFFLGLGQGFS